MKKTLIATTDYEGLRLLGTRRGQAVDHWPALQGFIARELGPDAASLLAEPEKLGDDKYDWYADGEGAVQSFAALSTEDRRRLLALAEARLKPLRDLANAASNDSKRAEFGEMLNAALSLPRERLDVSLYRVGDRPVLINWGARLNESGTPYGPLVIVLPDKPKSPVTSTFSWHIPLWMLFTVVSTAIFLELIEGCVLLRSLGIGPDFCSVDSGPSDPHLLAAASETAALQARLDYLSGAVLESPLCGRNAPAHVGSDNLKTIEPTPPPPPPAVEVPDASLDQTELQRRLNDSIRDAGGGACPGVEVLAAWDLAADIDLRLYCLPNDANTPDDTTEIVDAYNPENCDAQWDIGSAGSEATKPFLERICILKPDDQTERHYLATVYRENSDPASAVPVTLYVRGESSTESLLVNVEPQSEAESGIPISIQ